MTETFKPLTVTHKAKRWVVKVGTSVLTQQGRVTQQQVEGVASHIAALWKAGKETVLVTSGAIGIGMGVLDLKHRPTELAKLQAAAATGQGKLMQWYSGSMERDGFHAAQVLLTRGDMEDRQRRLNVKATLETLLQANIVPIINENDTVSTEEIRYGDNDILSAHVAALIEADFLVLLTDVENLLDLDGKPIHHVSKITDSLKAAAKGTDKSSSTGGMKTKLEAAELCLSHKIPMAVMSCDAFSDLIQDKDGKLSQQRGTWFA